MTGFEHKPKLYQLIWGEDTSYPGLEVTAKGASTGALLEITELADGMSAVPDPAAAGEAIRRIRKFFERFAGQLVAWNITEDGEPVPADYGGLAGLDMDLAMEIFAMWSRKVGGVDPTSPAGSNGGANSAEAPPPVLAASSVSLTP